jgi:hypothetical protein
MIVRWLRRHPLTVAYVLAVGGMVGAVAGIQDEADHRRAEDRRQAEVVQAQASAVTVKLCHTVNDQQAIIADVIDVVLDSGGGVSFTDIPGFKRLDQATQDYFRELEAALSADPGGSLEDRLREFAATRLIPAECT